MTEVHMTEPPGPSKAGKWAILAIIAGVGCLGTIVVAGILAAIAIPNFLAMQLRSKRSELPTYLDAIRVAEKAYYAEWDTYYPCGSEQMARASVPGRQAREWSADPASDCFSLLGWSPDGPTRGSYWVAVTAPGLDGTFTANAIGDIDGNGVPSFYTCNSDQRSTMVSANDAF